MSKILWQWVHAGNTDSGTKSLPIPALLQWYSGSGTSSIEKSVNKQCLLDTPHPPPPRTVPV